MEERKHKREPPSNYTQVLQVKAYTRYHRFVSPLIHGDGALFFVCVIESSFCVFSGQFSTAARGIRFSFFLFSVEIILGWGIHSLFL